MVTAAAQHILVSTEAECSRLKSEIEGGASFTDVAIKHSSCPSGKSGGVLGPFTPGQMVREFDEIVFKCELGVVHGPVKTQFGYHLINITSRN